jgi:hypothetical protein
MPKSLAAVWRRIGSISIESVNELLRADRLAGECGGTADVSENQSGPGS